MLATLVITGWSWVWLILGVFVGQAIAQTTVKTTAYLWKRRRE